MGETIECLKEVGKEPEERDRLIMLVMTGVRTGRHCLRRKFLCNGVASSSTVVVMLWASYRH